MHPITWSFYIDDDRVMHHPVHYSSGYNRIAKVVSKGLKVDIGGQQRGGFAVAGIYHLEEQRGVSGRFLLQTVKADFIDEQDLGFGVCFDFLLKTVIEIDTKLRESPVFGEPITRYAPQTRGAQQYRALAKELMHRA